MNLQAMLDWLAPRIVEDVADQSVQITAINGGLHSVCRFVMTVDPDAFFRIRLATLRHGVAYYPIKLDTKTVQEVHQLDSSSGLYIPLDYLSPRVVSGRASRSTGAVNSTRTVWSRRGRFVIISPTPSLDPAMRAGGLNEGLRFTETFMPTLSALDDEPPIDTDLHLAVVSRAHRLLLPVTAEWADLATALDAEYAALLEGWRESRYPVAEPEQIDVDDPGYPDA